MRLKRKKNKPATGTNFAQELKETRYYNFVLAYPFILILTIWLINGNISDRTNRRLGFALYFLLALPFYLLIVYFKEIVSLKLYILKMKENINKKIKLSKTEIAGIVALFDCIIAIFTLFILEKLL